MKKKALNLLVIFYIITLSTNAQITIEDDNKVTAGPLRTTDDPNNAITMQVNGNGGSCNYGGKISFGDFGTRVSSSWNVFIGEYEDDDHLDSDRLWLHGKNGIYMTKLDGSVDESDLIAKYDLYEGDKFQFFCSVYANNVLLTSDERFKENIKSLDSSLGKLKQLNAVSFNYNYPDSFSKINKASEAASGSDVELSEKESKELAKEQEYMRKLKEAEISKKKLGFIAQEVQEIYPELVEQDSSGYYYVDYIGMIPILTKALQEQQEMVESLSDKVLELEEIVSDFQKTKEATE